MEQSAQNILDRALELGSEESWEDLCLAQVAESLGVGLEDILSHYRSKDDLAEALFDRADQAMLKACSGEEFNALCGRERLSRVILAWLDALEPHRKLVADIFRYKLEPGHFHLQGAGITRISRTVQWMLEAAGSQTSHLGKIMEEFGTTSVYLASLAYWLTDNSVDAGKTRAFVDDLLRKTGGMAAWVNPDSLVAKSTEQQKTLSSRKE